MTTPDSEAAIPRAIQISEQLLRPGGASDSGRSEELTTRLAEISPGEVEQSGHDALRLVSLLSLLGRHSQALELATLLHSRSSALTQEDVRWRALNMMVACMEAAGDDRSATSLAMDAAIDAASRADSSSVQAFLNLARLGLRSNGPSDAARRWIASAATRSNDLPPDRLRQMGLATVSAQLGRMLMDTGAIGTAVDEMAAVILDDPASPSDDEDSLVLCRQIAKQWEFELARSRGDVSWMEMALDDLSQVGLSIESRFGVRSAMALTSRVRVAVNEFELQRATSSERGMTLSVAALEGLAAWIRRGHKSAMAELSTTESYVVVGHFELARRRGALDAIAVALSRLNEFRRLEEKRWGERHLRTAVSTANYATARFEGARLSSNEDDLAGAVRFLDNSAERLTALLGAAHPLPVVLGAEARLGRRMMGGGTGSAGSLAIETRVDIGWRDNETYLDAESAARRLETGTVRDRAKFVDDLGMSFADAIAGTIVSVEDGQIVQGIVVRVDKDEVLLDIGYKSEGVIPARELSIRNDVDPNEIVSVGDSVEALVLTKEDKEGRLVLSKKRAQYERAWGTIERIKEAEGTVEGPVIEVVKGGLIVDIGLRGFLPASLVELRRVRDLQPYVGKIVQAKIIELDKNRNNVVLSRRAFLEETQKESRDSFLVNLKPGEIREGVVSSVVSFGAFVDLGGMDGLIHVSELSWKHVDHPSEVVAVGDKVIVQVLDVDFDRERISLSLKATQQDPWQEFASTHEVGQLVYGRVTKLVPFGGFVQVGDGIEGLVHISEMSTHHVDSPEQVVTPGEELWVKIIDLDLARRRISLSIKQAAEGGELAEEYRQHFEIDEHGNWIAGADDAEREAAWAEYYPENPGQSPPVDDAEDAFAAPAAEAVAASVEAPLAEAVQPVNEAVEDD